MSPVKLTPEQYYDMQVGSWATEWTSNCAELGRMLAAFRVMDLAYVGEMLQLRRIEFDKQFLQAHGVGRKTLKILHAAVEQCGLEWGVSLPNWVRPDFRLTTVLQQGKEMQLLRAAWLTMHYETRRDVLRAVKEDYWEKRGSDADKARWVEAFDRAGVRSTEVTCNVSLHEKVGARAGRLNLMLEMLSDLKRELDGAQVTDDDLYKLYGMLNEYGRRWVDETAQLFKEWYNRRSGP